MLLFRSRGGMRTSTFLRAFSSSSNGNSNKKLVNVSQRVLRRMRGNGVTDRKESMTTTTRQTKTNQSIFDDLDFLYESNPNAAKAQPKHHTNVMTGSTMVSSKTVKSSSSSTSRMEPKYMTDEEIYDRMEEGSVKFFNLENDLQNNMRAVDVRRKFLKKKVGRDMTDLPYSRADFTDLYERVKGQCCENVIGVVPIPVGVAGPIVINGTEYYLPMATTEGALIASTTRGCKAIALSGGASAHVVADGMSRAPVIQVRDVNEAKAVQTFCEENFEMFADMFNATSRYARLKSIKCTIAGRKVYLRFTASSGDAMGMNMVGKGVEQALKVITTEFPDSFVLALSGNMCTDKKPSAINWVEGRGKSVAADCIIKGEVVKQVLKTSVEAIVETNVAKNLMGSALAGSIGGFNAHAANNVTAMFLATGQDPAQNVESSNCMTIMEPINDGEDLYLAVTMPSIEVGTIGGGTALPGQHAMLNLLGVAGSDPKNPGANAELFAKQVACGVMAGELSLTAALSSGHLISSHLRLNRKSGQ